jgi:hypothetical protein
MNMRKSRLSLPLNCPNCKHSGQARWQNADRTHLVALTEGFYSRDVGPHEPVRIFCAACKTEVQQE